MLRKYAGLVAVAGMMAGCMTTRQAEQVAAGDIGATVLSVHTGGALPAGTDMSVAMDSTLSTARAKSGDRFTASVRNAIIAQDGSVIVPRGARIYGRVTGVAESHRAADPAILRLEIEAIEFHGKRHPLRASVIDVANVVSRNLATGEVIQAPAARASIVAGAELDAIVSAGRLTAGTGTAISIGSGHAEHTIPAGTPMMLRVTETLVFR